MTLSRFLGPDLLSNNMILLDLRWVPLKRFVKHTYVKAGRAIYRSKMDSFVGIGSVIEGAPWWIPAGGKASVESVTSPPGATLKRTSWAIVLDFEIHIMHKPSDAGGVPGKNLSDGGRNQSTQTATFSRNCGSKQHNQQQNHHDHKSESESAPHCEDRLVVLIECDCWL